MHPDHRNQFLRGRSFVDADLRGAVFADADLRAADFTGANLSGADLSGARLGVSPARSAVLFALALAVVAAAGWLTGWTLGDILDEFRSTNWERVFGGALATLVVVVFIGAAIAGGLKVALLIVTVVFGVALGVNYAVLALASGEFDVGRDLRVVSLLVLLGASMVAGGLARVVGGTFGPIAIIAVALTGGFAAGRAGGGIAGLLVSMLLVVLAKRALTHDPRDRLANTIVERLVRPHSARFVGADLTDADATGTRITYCDTTGAKLSGLVWDGGVGPWDDREGGDDDR